MMPQLPASTKPALRMFISPPETVASPVDSQVRIGSYQGDVEQLADFVQRVWRDAYAGKMAFPLWSADYFRWHFGLDENCNRSHLLAAYDGALLAGVLLGLPRPLKTPDHHLQASLWSWLSVDSAYRGQRLAVRLDAERVSRMRAAGTDLIFSYRFVGSRHSQAERPKPIGQQDKQFLRKIGLWVRVLDAPKMYHWSLNRAEGFCSLLGRPLTAIPGTGRDYPAIRPLRAADLPACLELLQEHTAGMALAVDWNLETLAAHLLGHPISQSLVYETGGQIRGLINFHLLPVQARTVESVGFLDVLAVKRLTHTERVRFINAAMGQMRQQGAILVLKPRTGDVSTAAMLQTHWIPKPADSHLVLQWTAPRVPVQPDYPLHLLWR